MNEPRTLIEIDNIRLVITDMGILFEQNVKDIFGGNAYRYYPYDNLSISEWYQFTSRVARKLNFYIDHSESMSRQLEASKAELAITKRRLTIAKKKVTR